MQGTWLWLSLCLIVPNPLLGYLYSNDEDAELLGRLLSSDYLNQDDLLRQELRPAYSDVADYSIYQDLPSPSQYQHLPSNQARVHHVAQKTAPAPVKASSRPSQFPKLTAKQKQFAVSPGYKEYYSDHPDFLKFHLQALEEGQTDKELEQQLEAMVGAGEDAKRALEGGVRAEPLVAAEFTEYGEDNRTDDLFFTTIIAVCTAASVFVVIGAGFCYHRSAGRAKEQEEVEYPAYGVTGPAKEASPAGDRKLAQSAQMYHYQHQKNQMIAINRGNGGPGTHSGGEESEGEMEGEGEEGDYTVYECPGLASTDEMEVKNPLFNDDPTPKNP